MSYEISMYVQIQSFDSKMMSFEDLVDLAKRLKSFPFVELVCYFEHDRQSIKEQYEVDCKFWHHWNCELPYTLDDEYESIEYELTQLHSLGVIFLELDEDWLIG